MHWCLRFVMPCRLKRWREHDTLRFSVWWYKAKSKASARCYRCCSPTRCWTTGAEGPPGKEMVPGSSLRRPAETRLERLPTEQHGSSETTAAISAQAALRRWDCSRGEKVKGLRRVEICAARLLHIPLSLGHDMHKARRILGIMQRRSSSLYGFTALRAEAVGRLRTWPTVFMSTFLGTRVGGARGSATRTVVRCGAPEQLQFWVTIFRLQTR